MPTDQPEAERAQGRGDISGSWAGGTEGMQVTEQLLERLEVLLSPTGRFYLVAIKLNDVPGISRRLLARNLITQVSPFSTVVFSQQFLLLGCAPAKGWS